MNEFSADSEFYGNYLKIRESLVSLGWQETNPKIQRRIISAIFTKDGYATCLIFGCEEEVKNEVI